MAITSASGVECFNTRTPTGPRKNAAGTLSYEVCQLSFVVTGTYDNAAHCQIVNAHTLIANMRRDGKTVAILDACAGGPGDESGTPINAQFATANRAANTILFNLTQGDLVTERGNSVIGTFNAPIVINVAYTVSPPT